MNRKRSIQNTLIIALGIAITCLSVVYAAYDTNLAITGQTTIRKANWSVHLENPQKTANTSATVQESIPLSIDEDGLELSFAAALRPGETYEFTVDVKNSGTFDAKLSSYSLTAKENGNPVSITDGANSYADNNLQYEVLGVAQDEELLAGQSSTKTIRITALQKEGVVETEERVYEFAFNMQYVQKNNK